MTTCFSFSLKALQSFLTFFQFTTKRLRLLQSTLFAQLFKLFTSHVHRCCYLTVFVSLAKVDKQTLFVTLTVKLSLPNYVKPRQKRACFGCMRGTLFLGPLVRIIGWFAMNSLEKSADNDTQILRHLHANKALFSLLFGRLMYFFAVRISLT